MSLTPTHHRTPQRPLSKILLPAPPKALWTPPLRNALEFSVADMLFSNTIEHYSYSATHLTFHFLTAAINTTNAIKLCQNHVYLFRIKLNALLVPLECAISNVISFCKNVSTCRFFHIFHIFPGWSLFLICTWRFKVCHWFLSEPWNPISFLYSNIVIIAYKSLRGF